MEKYRIKKELAALCMEVLILLKIARDQGLITDEEYEAHSRLKNEFLEQFKFEQDTVAKAFTE